MAKDWKGELKDIITSNQNQIKNVIDDRNKREKERLKKLEEIKKIIKPRFEYVKELLEKEKYLISTVEPLDSDSESNKTDGAVYEEQSLDVRSGFGSSIKVDNAQMPGDTDERSKFIDSCRRGESVPIPKIKESTTELVLIMPVLSEVNRLDLMYQIEFKDEKPILHAYELLSQGKMQNNGKAHDKYEDFVQDTLKRFLLSWFRRKEGTELDKERKFELKFVIHALKDV